VDRYAAAIVRLIGGSYGPQALEQAWRELRMAGSFAAKIHILGLRELYFVLVQPALLRSAATMH
jgi:hypothetical protein